MSSNKPKNREKIALCVHASALHLLRRLRKSDSTFGLSAPRLSVLSVLVFGGDKTLGELALAEQVKPPTMTKLVQALESDGFVKRSQIQSDKRAVRVRATAKGRRILERARKRRVSELVHRMAPLNRDQLDTLLQASTILDEIVLRETD